MMPYGSDNEMAEASHVIKTWTAHQRISNSVLPHTKKGLHWTVLSSLASPKAQQ